MVGKERQMGFGDERSVVKKQRRREAFRDGGGGALRLAAQPLEPFYPRVGPQGGRPPYPLEVM